MRAKNKKNDSIKDIFPDYEMPISNITENKLLKKSKGFSYEDEAYGDSRSRAKPDYIDDDNYVLDDSKKEHIFKIHKNCIDIGVAALREATTIYEYCRK